MRDRSSMIVPLVLMMLLVGITYWISHIMQEDATSQLLRHDPDYIISHFNVRRFDANGMLQHTLIAEKMTHYPDDDTTLVISPHLTNHRPPQTEIFAQQALVSKDSKEIDFINDVRVVRQGINAQTLSTVMETRLLKVFPDDETGYTLTPVTITQGKSIIKGSRLELDNKSGISVLHGRVTGTLYRNQATLP
ncbi:MAG: LPS export ABC transporter periplasmic protein LptC [Rugosibacter sp.]|nr:LPS export ABC transporter periplasmic protein LptC [Rugosibacter sp.]